MDFVPTLCFRLRSYELVHCRLSWICYSSEFESGLNMVILLSAIVDVISLQFLGFGVGDSVNDCQSFVAPYFAMAVSTINFIVMRKIEKKFQDGQDPYKYEEFGEPVSTSHVNPIGTDSSRGIQMAGLLQVWRRFKVGTISVY